MDSMEMFSLPFRMAADTGVSGGTETPTQPATPATTPPVTPAAPTPTAPATEPEKKSLTQAEIDALVAGAKKEGAEKNWKKHGFASEKEFDDFLTAAKADADAKKTEAQREKERADKLEAEKAEVLSRVEKAEAKAAALEAGVAKEKVDKLVKLLPTYEGETVEAKIQAILVDFPEFKAVTTPPVPNAKTPIKNQYSPSMAAADAELDKVFGARPAK